MTIANSLLGCSEIAKQLVSQLSGATQRPIWQQAVAESSCGDNKRATVQNFRKVVAFCLEASNCWLHTVPNRTRQGYVSSHLKSAGLFLSTHPKGASL